MLVAGVAAVSIIIAYFSRGYKRKPIVFIADFLFGFCKVAFPYSAFRFTIAQRNCIISP